MNKHIEINTLLKSNIVFFGLFPVIPDRFKGVLVIVLFLLALVYFFKEKPSKLKVKTFIINSSLYLTYLITLINTSNIDRAIKTLTETRLTAFLLPLIFLLLSQNKEIYKKHTIRLFIQTFIYSTLLFCILYFLYLPFAPVSANPFFEFPSVFFFRNGITRMPLLGIDPIYASLYIGLSIIFIFINIIECKKIKFLQIIYLLTFATVLVVLSSKMAIITVLLILSFLIFKYFLNKFRLKILFLFSLFLFVLLIFQIPTIKSRTKELLNIETFTKYKRNNSTSIRISIYRCGVELIKNNIIFGVGVGDVNDELLKCYGNISNDLVYEKYNSHNQYLSILIGGGLVIFLIFIYFLYYNINIAIQSKDKILLYVIIFYSINFFSENILERQNGVILFYFFISYLSQQVLINNDKNL